jgi:hypothetical protein
MNKVLVVLFLWFFIVDRTIDAQTHSGFSSDTVYIYETVIEYDTVYVHDTITINDKSVGNILEFIQPKKAEVNLLLDTNHDRANAVIFSGGHAATFPVNRIMYSENIKNSTDMKKVSFIGLTLFAFNSMVLAQTDFGISAGGGLWWTNCNYSYVKTEFSPYVNLGPYLQLPVGNHLNLGLGVNYHFLFNNYGYKTELGTKIATGDTIYSDIILLGDGEAASNYHQFSIPMEISYRIGKLSPFVGFEYSYRISESWLDKSQHSYGLLGGINYTLSEKFGLSVNYYCGLTKDYEYSGDYFDPSVAFERKIGSYNVSWKSSRVGVTLQYSLKKTKQQ